MKNLLITTIRLTLALLAGSTASWSQCENTDFEYGNFTNWTGYTGFCCGGGITTPGIVNGRHTIITQSTMDPLTNNMISTMPVIGGGAYSVRLGNSNVGGEAERLVRPFTVTSANQLFIYQYALVLEDPEGHPPVDKPKFEVQVRDANGNIINPPACGYYEVTAGPETNLWGQNGDVRYKDWSTVGIDLAAYIGTTVTIEFMVQDCGWGGHFGYAYLDAACGYLDIKVIGFCEGTPTVTLVAPGGFDSYFWPHSGETTQTVVIPAPEVGDSIAVEVTNQSGCSTTILHIFEEFPLVDAGVGNDTAICAGQPVDLWCIDAGPNANYSWFANGNPISTEQLLTVTPLVTTTYEVIVSNPNGCYSPDSSAALTVTVDNELVFQLPPDTIICQGDSFTLNAPLPNYTYLWYTATDGTIGTGVSVTVAPTEMTTYYLQIGNASCSYTDSIVLDVFNAETFPDSIPTAFCQGDPSVVLIGPDSFADYLWSNGSTANNTTINPYVDSIIQLHLVSPGGCQDSVVYLLTEAPFPVPFIFIPDDTLCMGHSALLSASSSEPGSSFSWTATDGSFSGTGNSVLAFPTYTTTYIVQAISPAGCTDQTSYDTITVYMDSSAFYVFPAPIELCEGMSATLHAPIDALSYEWSVEETVISLDPILVISPPFTQSYYLTTHSATCDYADYQTVLVHNVSVTSPTVYSCITAGSITLNAPPDYVSYYWPLFNNSTISNVLSNPAEGQVVELHATNQFTCVDTFRFQIDLLDPTLLLPLTDDTVCYEDAVSFQAQSDYSFDTYLWTSVPAGAGSTDAFFSANPTVNTAYTVTVSNPYNCVAAPNAQTALITVLDDYLIPPIDPVAVCSGSEVTVASPGTSGSFSWDYFGVHSDQPAFVFTPNQSGDVLLTVTMGSCSTSAFIPVTVFTPYFYTINAASTAICSGEAVTMNLQPGSFTQVDWSTNSNVFSSDASVTVSPATSTVYTASVTDPNGCLSQSDQPIDVTATPVVNLGPDRIICAVSSTELSSPATNANYQFMWSTNETGTTLQVSNSGVYSLTAINGNCVTTDTIAIQFILQSYLGEVPNVITPNGDLLNEQFEIHSMNISDYEIVIVNRWGNRIFQSNDPAISWDGTTGGKEVQEGVYFYTIRYKLACGTDAQTAQGHVTVSR